MPWFSYELVLSTDISAGHILLSKVLQSSSYRTVTDTEKDNWADGIEDALAAAADAQETADGKILSFYQTYPPSSGMSFGDLWFDTNDNNKVYRYNGSSWVSVKDLEIAEAIQAASDAQATADGKVVTFYRTTPPTAEGIGDLWVDTNDKNKLYRWSGSSWVSIRDTDIAAALQIAESKAKVFTQTWAPTSGMQAGDIWYDTTGLTSPDIYKKPYTYDGAAWRRNWFEVDGGDITVGTIDCQKVTIRSVLGSNKIEINDSVIAGYAGAVKQFEIRASNGKAYAGAGAVVLDASGITVKGAKLTLQKSDGGYSAELYVDTSGLLRLDGWTSTIVEDLRPLVDKTQQVGEPGNYRFYGMYSKFFVPTTDGGFIFNTVAGAYEGNIKVKGGGSGDIYVYSNGAWRINA